MDFFAQQDLARSRTTRLVVLMLLATAALVATTSVILALLLGLAAARDEPGGAPAQAWLDATGQLLGGPLVGLVAIAVVAGVALGALYKYLRLRRGGPAVAEALGARRIDPAATDPHERRLLNVVEEMALASGIPVPPVYVIEDAAINAFAAGHTPRDAVIGVTRGCLTALERDELQGVVAHEFSHIFHGDMRLNLRLVALLHGLLLLGLMGYYLLRVVPLRQRSRDQGLLFVLLAGVTLMAMGFAGTLAGRLIKAAVSRQREFLADAAAVQYTRDPRGLAGALKKIAASDAGSRLDSPRAAEFGHLFFGEAVRASRVSLMATHPPLRERIARLDPGWDGSLPTPRAAGPADASPACPRVRTRPTLAATALAIDAIGQPGRDHVAAAHALLQDLEPALRAAARDAVGAQAIACALVLDQHADTRERQHATLRREAPATLTAALAGIEPTVLALDAEQRLPLLELALPGLRGLARDEVDALLRRLRALVAADQRVTLLEWGLYNVIARTLRERRDPVGQARLAEHAADCAWLLSAFARLGGADAAAAEGFRAGAQRLGLDLRPQTAGLGSAHLLDDVVGRLAALAPREKALLLRALAEAAQRDGVLPPVAAVLLRAVSLSLDCPLPPLAQAAA